MDLVKFLEKTIGKETIEKAKQEFVDVKNKLEAHHTQNIKDSKLIAEVLQEINIRLKNIEDKIK